jgi:3D-(3,5/4)-trihydroxycyclohexane-1,2-dione acylhydrolase (decyclizing)
MPAIPSCTVAGAFGIARITGTPGAMRSSMYAVGIAAATETTVIVIETDPLVSVPSYEAWWEVVPAEASEQEGVRKARQDWSANQKRQRRHI